MRKIRAVLLGFVLVLSSVCVCFTACGKETRRSAYNISAEYFPEQGKLQAEMTADIINTSQNVLSELKFQLYANAYREGAKFQPVSERFYGACYYDGASYGNIEITSVSGGEWRVCGEDENILSVSLAKPLYPEECARVTVCFTVTLAKNRHRLGIGENAVNLAYFYPVLCHLNENGFTEYTYSYCGDPFVSDCADYTVQMTVPEDYTLVYGGTGESVAQNGKATYNIVANDVRDVAFVLGKEFQVETAQAGGVRVEYYYLRDEEPRTTLSAAVDALCFYSETFSPYKEKRYVLAETDFVYGGMEYSGMAVLSDTLHKSERIAAVAHETAHQWWYFKVGSNQVEEAWQDEGLAEYSTALFFGEYPDYGSSYRDRVALSERAYRAYFSVYSQLGGANTCMSRALGSFSGEYEYRSVAYDKGVIMFDRVRQAVGEKKFFSALKHYAEKYERRQATRADLVGCFEAAGTDAEGLFASFLDGLCVI